MKKLILSTVILFFGISNLYSQQLNKLLPQGKCGVGTLNPQTYLQIHGTTTYSLTPPKLVDIGNLPTVLTANFGYSSNLLMTNEVCGSTVDDGTMIHQSENDFYITNQEPGGKIVMNSTGNLSLITNGNSIIMEGGTRRIYVGSTIFTIDNQYADFNIFSGGGYRALNVRSTSGVGVSIQTANTQNALQIFGNINLTLKNFSVNGGGEVFSRKIEINSTLPETEDQVLFTVNNAGRKVFQINNNGLVQSREVKVDLQSWPDYVFEPSYALMPLVQLEQYIITNHHLPEIPTASTVEQEGLNLGEMNKLLMQKVEELTLYLIEQDKKLKQQAERIEALESKQK